MINVICLKWGTKYSSKYVNRLFKMVSINLSKPFDFYCYTDNPKGLYKEIKIIPIEDDYLEIYWNKLSMFKKDFIPKGICLYFDLDIVIQKKLDPLLDYLCDDLTMIKSYWKGEDCVTDGSSLRFKERWDMYANSSILLWKSNKLTHIWDHFYENADYYIVEYKGIDRYLFHQKFKINYFPKGLIYSRLSGRRLEDLDIIDSGWVNIINPNNPGNSWDLFHLPEYTVCLFNGPTEEWMYKGFENYWS